MLYRFLQTRIVRSEAFDRKGYPKGSVLKPQFRVMRWLDFKESNEAGEKVSVISDTIDDARRFILLKTGKIPASKTVITVVE